MDHLTKVFENQVLINQHQEQEIRVRIRMCYQRYLFVFFTVLDLKYLSMPDKRFMKQTFYGSLLANKVNFLNIKRL